VPVVVAAQARSARVVFERTAQRLGAPLALSGRHFTWIERGRPPRVRPPTSRRPVQRLRVACAGPLFPDGGTGYDVRLPLLGIHQLENAATAVAVLEVWRRIRKGAIDPTAISRVRWPGRLQILRRSPIVVADGAHNRASAALLRASLSRHFTGVTDLFVIGVAADKDLRGIALELGIGAGVRVITTRSRSERALSPEAVAAAFGPSAETAPSVAAALDRALTLAGPHDLICATGSLQVVAEALEWAGVPGPCGQ
jgi:dihydrofolate synthase/folylpolyglutamate synthase